MYTGQLLQSIADEEIANDDSTIKNLSAYVETYCLIPFLNQKIKEKRIIGEPLKP